MGLQHSMKPEEDRQTLILNSTYFFIENIAIIKLFRAFLSNLACDRSNTTGKANLQQIEKKLVVKMVLLYLFFWEFTTPMQRIVLY